MLTWWLSGCNAFMHSVEMSYMVIFTFSKKSFNESLDFCNRS